MLSRSPPKHNFDEDNKTIINGVYIFLDNFLGELNSVAAIDNLTVIGKADALKELIPIEKLKDFLIWREKEFVEKYEVLRYNSEDDTYSTLSAELENGRPITAMVNTTLLEWDGKASHPWLLNIEIQYDGEVTNGMPDDGTYQILKQMEEEMMGELKEADGYLNAARKTDDNSRNVRENRRRAIRCPGDFDPAAFALYLPLYAGKAPPPKTGPTAGRLA